MGQKVNPIIFRQAISRPQASYWFAKDDAYKHILSQELEIKKFVGSLLKLQGILVRTCKIIRSDNSIFLELDLYFSYVLSKQSKFLWAKSFFKVIRKKYRTLGRIKDLKGFLESLETTSSDKTGSLSFSNFSKKKFIDNDNSSIGSSLDYKKRFFFLLILKEKKKFLLKKKKKMSLLSITKRSFLSKLVRVKLPKLGKLFKLKKLDYRFRDFWCKNTCFMTESSSTVDLLNLNKSLCKSLQHFSGFENVSIKIYSSQLSFLPSLKHYYSFLTKELLIYQRNKSLSGYFFETLEILYFVLGTFSFGNAALLGKLLVFLLENSRKHVFIVRFIKKILDTLFKKLPTTFLAVNGIKILIKGRFNKRRRTKTLIIQEGQISLQTLSTAIDYNQTFAVTLYGSFGIKVWLSKK